MDDRYEKKTLTPWIVDWSKHVLIYWMHSLGLDKNDPAFSLKSDKIKSGLVLGPFSLLDENRKLVLGKVIYTVHYGI